MERCSNWPRSRVHDSGGIARRIILFYQTGDSLKVGREREMHLIRRCYRAAAIGRLMLGEFSDWGEYWSAAEHPLEKLDRTRLRATAANVRQRLQPEIDKFCSNFQAVDEKKLEQLYLDTRDMFRRYPHTANIRLIDFEEKYGAVQSRVRGEVPRHATMRFSLWGLQYWFPEDQLSKDVSVSLQLLDQANNEARRFHHFSHSSVVEHREEVGAIIRKREHAVRSAVLTSLALIEAYIDGLAWDFLAQSKAAQININHTDLRYLENANSKSLNKKLTDYPKIITGRKLWDENHPGLTGLQKFIKPFRDAIVHPSPFDKPERYGGYDKLELLQTLEPVTAIICVGTVVALIKEVHTHMHSADASYPTWLSDLEHSLERSKTESRHSDDQEFSD